jgi:hypothetical protein
LTVLQTNVGGAHLVPAQVCKPWNISIIIPLYAGVPCSLSCITFFQNNIQDIVENLETPVKKFLASLDHDLTFAHDALKKQRLGTANKLFPLANFPDLELHELFKEALPDITVAERYILIKGLKKRM